MANGPVVKPDVVPIVEPAMECPVLQEYPWHRVHVPIIVLILPDGSHVAYKLGECRMIQVQTTGGSKA